MYVLIDPSERETFVFYFSVDLVTWTKKVVDSGACPHLLGALIVALADEGVVLASLAGIAVRVGKGSFTRDRVAVTIVNMLVFSLKIPAVTVDAVDFTSLNQRFQSLGEARYIVATYSSPPNVGAKQPYLG